MYSFLFDIYEKTFGEHLILSSIVALYISFKICMVVFLSVSQWNTYPVQFTCSNLSNKCALNKYSYKHTLCWDRLFFRGGTPSTRKCSLPKIKDSSIENIVFDDIQDVKVKSSGNKNQVFLLMKDGSEQYIYNAENISYANKIVNDIKNYIDMCLNPSENTLNELIDNKCETEVWINK